MPCLISVKRQQRHGKLPMGYLFPLISGVSGHQYGGRTSVSIFLLSYFQNIPTAVKLEDFKAACVLFTFSVASVVSIFLRTLSNTLCTSIFYYLVSSH